MDIHTNSMTDRWINWTGWISYNPFNSFVKAIILESYFHLNKRAIFHPADCRDSHPPLCVEENHNSSCLPPTKPCWSTHYCCTITGAQDYERPMKYTDCFVMFHFVGISSVSVIYVNDLSRFFRVTSLAFGQWYNCPSDSEVWAQSTSRKHNKTKNILHDLYLKTWLIAILIFYDRVCVTNNKQTTVISFRYKGILRIHTVKSLI